MICFDTETTGIDANEAELVGLSFSVKPSEAWYVPCPEDQKKTKEILSVEILPLKETRKQMFEENLIFKEDGAGLDGIQLALLTKEIAKNNEKGLKEVNVVHPSLGIKCRIENIVMVTNDWKENYLNLDKEIKKLDKITFIPLTDDLIKLTRKWISENNMKENNKNVVKI